jgi:hypothetical protein
MNYVTTNIRIAEEDYLRLKAEAAQKRTSLSAIVREKIQEKTTVRSKAEVEKLLAWTRKVAKENAKHLKGVDIVKVLHEMRYAGKW